MDEVSVLNYMYDQPRALKSAFDQREIFITPFIELFAKNNIKKVLFFGSGTSYNAAIIAAHYFKQIVGIDAVGYYPTVFKNYEKADWTNTLKKEEILFVGISQSGTSISTIDVMKKAKNDGYQTIVLTENLESEITNHTDKVAHLLCGKELTPPETRGYTVTMLTLYIWAVEIAYFKNIYSETNYKQAISEIDDFVKNFDIVIKESSDWYERNKITIVNSDRIYVMGYGVDFGSVLEGMLKIGEMLRIPTIGYEIEEYSHGPTMAITNRQTLFMIGSDEIEWERCLQFREVFKKYTNRVHLITCKETQIDDRDIQFTIHPNKYLCPIMYTIPFQFVAAKGAKDIGIDTNINPFVEPLAHLEE
ncbi:MAG: SIS domain-containing protein [Anaerorhabdus sp.]|uniref:SIS domain-containing protein n=1 Tax=Anaerorhabdus sp. TaxID=1872524 RepID=UPI002FCBCD9E